MDPIDNPAFVKAAIKQVTAERRAAAPVVRWDVYDIADELEDVIAALSRNSTADVPDELAELRALVRRTWEASRLDTAAAHELRNQRHAAWCAQQGLAGDSVARRLAR